MYEFIIKEDGSIVKREWNDHPINITPAIEKAFQSNMSVRLPVILDFTDMGETHFGKCSMSFQTGDMTKVWVSTRVKLLNLHTTFVLDGEHLVPTFDVDGKFMEIPWTPPTDMKLVIGMTVGIDTTNTKFKLGKHYLVAYDAKGATWRMPLTNLYDHLELCHGQAHAVHPTMMGAVYIGLKMFRASKWNSDLRGSWHKLMVPQMFRFKPTDKGFDQIGPEANWTSLCTKASVEVVNTKIQPIDL